VTPAPAKSGGPCPAETLILALGVGAVILRPQTNSKHYSKLKPNAKSSRLEK
jgi:hypothetical protein